MLLDVRLLACLVALPLSGCGTLYLAQAAAGQWQVMAARRPIAAVVADPATPAPLRARLEEVAEARDFATHALGLPGGASYRQYAAIGRPYVVWNVVAAPEFSVSPREWCFPVAGCVAYRGYFSERRARDYALTLESRGYDVALGGVAAYSTLGRFADPVLSSMLAYGDVQLAAVIFHELAHQVAYVPGDSAFNEAFAVSVEQEGLARWLAARGRSDALAQWRARRAGQAEVAALFAAARVALRTLYAGPLAATAKRAEKRAILRELAGELRAFEQRTGLASGYARWFDAGLNNAVLASVATYNDCVPGFERVLQASGGDLPRYYAAVKALAAGPAAGRAALCARRSAQRNE
ncbi:MAG: aminopeptidase [Steroidobacteraceae bacterium]